jgi:hypothetical protein
LRDFLAGSTLLLCLIVSSAAVISLFRPMAKLGMGTRKRALGGLGIGFGLLAATAVIIPEPPGAPPVKIAAATASPAALHKAAPDLPAIEHIALPPGAPPAPVSGFCSSNGICETNRAKFELQDWPKAWRGDYQGQRNVAYCLASGCEGAVKVNQFGACAWRMIILASKHDDADDSDVSNLKLDCEKLDDVGMAAAHARSQDIFSRISKG